MVAVLVLVDVVVDVDVVVFEVDVVLVDMSQYASTVKTSSFSAMHGSPSSVVK